MTQTQQMYFREFK